VEFYVDIVNRHGAAVDLRPKWLRI
jgi:hypothetical protein